MALNVPWNTNFYKASSHFSLKIAIASSSVAKFSCLFDKSLTLQSKCTFKFALENDEFKPTLTEFHIFFMESSKAQNKRITKKYLHAINSFNQFNALIIHKSCIMHQK